MKFNIYVIVRVSDTPQAVGVWTERDMAEEALAALRLGVPEYRYELNETLVYGPRDRRQ